MAVALICMCSKLLGTNAQSCHTPRKRFRRIDSLVITHETYVRMVTCSNILMLDPLAGCVHGSLKQLYKGFLIAIHALILLATVCMVICMLVIYLL